MSEPGFRGSDEKPSRDISGIPESPDDDVASKEQNSPTFEDLKTSSVNNSDVGAGAGVASPTRSPVGTGMETSTERPLRPWALRILLWTPKRCRYDPNNPPEFTMFLNILFGFAACFTVATLYYNQPVLDKIAETFEVTYEKASSVATLLQAGYAAGLLFLCPLGDIVKRRPFILGLTWITALLWLGLCITTNFQVFAALSFLCGVTTVTPQLMLPLVGDFAPPARRASSLSIVVSGLMLGMLAARLLSGTIANYTSWRDVYWLAFGLQHLILVVLFFFLPDYPSTNKNLSYVRILTSIIRMFFSEPLLVQACIIALCMSASFTSFWTTLTFLLASPPYEYPSLTIGLFSLIGIVVIVGGPFYGRLITDRLTPWLSSMIGQVLALAGVIVGAFTGEFTVAGPVVQAVAIDVGSQTASVANRAAIYTIDPKARNRLNTAYMVMAFVGQLSGTSIGNRLYDAGGWTWSGACGMGFIAFSILIGFAKGPHEPGWFGWSGGWAMRAVRPKDTGSPGEESGKSGSSLDVEAAPVFTHGQDIVPPETTKEGECGRSVAVNGKTA
ncbi:related to dityrosine transporter [Cephalotrichum gorgonifer]|uniref:Related to dityrosine transporter n=1 Tax=Cephalotrichum gorgonifer TaxID=2041049 RepID=A0AAE8N2C7_9PEZI|nr:related to dityrosine transporter [Cephalotrichum gorgonifer]